MTDRKASDRKKPAHAKKPVKQVGTKTASKPQSTAQPKKPRQPRQSLESEAAAVSQNNEPKLRVSSSVGLVRGLKGTWHWLWLLSLPIRWPICRLWQAKWGIFYLTLLLASIVAIPTESARQSTKDVRYNAGPAELQKIPRREVAIVFGAGVQADNTPTPYLKHRVGTAVDLLKAGKVDRLLMSGDNSTKEYDEPTVMKTYAISLGADPTRILLDYAGYNTYDTCYRARKVFGVSSAAVVTQGYHLPRATMTCLQIGIDTVGVAAKRNGRDWTAAYILREYIATAKASVQLFLEPPPTVLGPGETS